MYAVNNEKFIIFNRSPTEVVRWTNNGSKADRIPDSNLIHEQNWFK